MKTGDLVYLPAETMLMQFNKEIEDLDVKPDMTPRKMATNFMRKNNAFKVNRVILSRFIDLITAKTTV